MRKRDSALAVFIMFAIGCLISGVCHVALGQIIPRWAPEEECADGWCATRPNFPIDNHLHATHYSGFEPPYLPNTPLLVDIKTAGDYLCWSTPNGIRVLEKTRVPALVGQTDLRYLNDFEDYSYISAGENKFFEASTACWDDGDEVVLITAGSAGISAHRFNPLTRVWAPQWQYANLLTENYSGLHMWGHQLVSVKTGGTLWPVGARLMDRDTGEEEIFLQGFFGAGSGLDDWYVVGGFNGWRLFYLPGGPTEVASSPTQTFGAAMWRQHDQRMFLAIQNTSSVIVWEIDENEADGTKSKVSILASVGAERPIESFPEAVVSARAISAQPTQNRAAQPASVQAAIDDAVRGYDRLRSSFSGRAGVRMERDAQTVLDPITELPVVGQSPSIAGSIHGVRFSSVVQGSWETRVLRVDESDALVDAAPTNELLPWTLRFGPLNAPRAWWCWGESGEVCYGGNYQTLDIFDVEAVEPPDEAIFADGFESGDIDAWTRSKP